LSVFEIPSRDRAFSKELEMANTKTPLTRKVYTYADGRMGRSARPGATKMTFEFVAPIKDAEGNLVVLETREINLSEFPAGVIECATFHGFGQKFTDDLAGIAGKAAKDEATEHPERGFVDYAVERFDDMMDNLRNGVWVSESEGGGKGSNVTILHEAIVSVFAEAGTELSDEQKAGIMTKLADEEYRTAAKDRPDVAYQVKRITAERAAARAKEAKAKAKAAGSQELGGLLA
jgi:hypothetical protein